MSRSSSEDNQSAVGNLRSSCHRFTANAKHVKIDEKEADRLASQLLESNAVPTLAPSVWPLKFSSQRSEVNFLSTLALLNCGSGFRKWLQDKTGRGAYDTIQYGLLAMQMSGEINCDHMLRLSLIDVASNFGLSSHILDEYEIRPGIKSTRPAPLHRLVEILLSMLQKTGHELRNLGCDDFYDFIFHPTLSKEEKNPNNMESADHLLGRLTKYLSGFQDHYKFRVENKNSVDGKSGDTEEILVHIYKKAQILIRNLNVRFAAEDPRFTFPGVDSLTILSDNVVPAVLRAEKVLTVSNELASIIDNGKLLEDLRMETELRAAAIVACEQMVAKMNEISGEKDRKRKINEGELDEYLWKIGKSDKYRGLKRHASPSKFY